MSGDRSANDKMLIMVLSHESGEQTKYTPLRISTHCSTPERRGEVANWDSIGPKALAEGAINGDKKGMESVAGLLLKPTGTNIH